MTKTTKLKYFVLLLLIVSLAPSAFALIGDCAGGRGCVGPGECMEYWGGTCNPDGYTGSPAVMVIHRLP